MEQPTPGTFAGINQGTLVAALLGAALSLGYAKETTPLRYVLAFATGVAAAFYLAPLAVHYLSLGDGFESAFAFIIGFTAFRAIPALLSFVDRLRDIKLPWIG